MKHIATLSALATAITVVTAGPALADPGNGHAYGHDKQKWKKHERAEREAERAYEQGYREGRRDAIRYGDRSYTDYYIVEDYSRYNLAPPPRGHYYARVDGDIVMVQLATQLVTELLIGQ